MKNPLPILACLAIGLSTLTAEETSPSAQRQTQTLVDDAVADFETEKFDDSIKKLDEANKLTPKAPFILNLLGAAYTKKKDYTKAESYFKEALDVQFDFFPARYNIGELYFLQKMYPQALSHFSGMLTSNPGNELLKFKIVLCLLQTNQDADARKMVDEMSYPGSEPAWFYSKAALAYKEGKKKKAREYTDSAKVLFSTKEELYAETFRDLGWNR